jgi:hypothetical protein
MGVMAVQEGESSNNTSVLKGDLRRRFAVALRGKSALNSNDGSQAHERCCNLDGCLYMRTYMKYFSAISFAKISLIMLLLAALNFNLSTIDAHFTEARHTVFAEDVVDANPVKFGQTVQHQEYADRRSGTDEVNHSFGDCHAHILESEVSKLTCGTSPEGRLLSWPSDPLVLAVLQGFYRPPRG